jgi:predicted O-methyltransferase YrrM
VLRILKRIILNLVDRLGYAVLHKSEVHRLRQPPQQVELEPVPAPAPSDEAAEVDTPPCAGGSPASSIEVDPRIDLELPPGIDYSDPVAAFVDTARTPEFQRIMQFLAASSPRSLLPPAAQAHLYVATRVLKPAAVVEIGSYRGGTAEVFARALAANRFGQIHTVAPHEGHLVRANLAAWPEAMRERAVFHEMNSAEFFARLGQSGQTAQIFLIDGNHDLDFVAFDLSCAARCSTPGALIFADNLSQPGVYWACKQFLRDNPEWTCFGMPARETVASELYDPSRSTIANTDFLVLIGPGNTVLQPGRCYAPGIRHVAYRSVRGLKFRVGNLSAPRRLHLQIVLRVTETLEEKFGAARVVLQPGAPEQMVILDQELTVGPVTSGAIFVEYLMMIDDGIAEPIALLEEPEIQVGSH